MGHRFSGSDQAMTPDPIQRELMADGAGCKETKQAVQKACAAFAVSALSWPHRLMGKIEVPRN
jgi:hypothetical protein